MDFLDEVLIIQESKVMQATLLTVLVSLIQKNMTIH